MYLHIISIQLMMHMTQTQHACKYRYLCGQKINHNNRTDYSIDSVCVLCMYSGAYTGSCWTDIHKVLSFVACVDADPGSVGVGGFVGSVPGVSGGSNFSFWRRTTSSAFRMSLAFIRSSSG